MNPIRDGLHILERKRGAWSIIWEKIIKRLKERGPDLFAGFEIPRLKNEAWGAFGYGTWTGESPVSTP